MANRQAKINGIGVLYEEGLTAAEIGTRMKMKKDQVLELLAIYLEKKYE